MSGISVPDPDAAPALDPAVVKAMAGAFARLQARYPTASPALVLRCVDDAADGLPNARTQKYLSILIERRASEALLEVVRSHESRN
jgi:hypothetical protein